MEQYAQEIGVLLGDGSRTTAALRAEERDDGNRPRYKVTIHVGDVIEVGESESGFFDALRMVRGKLEKAGTSLSCFGASEDVYPSPMQESMGPAVLAYRNYLGRQASSKDIVNIF